LTYKIDGNKKENNGNSQNKRTEENMKNY